MNHKDALLDLLAVIHRDGGQYVANHGLEKAIKDAEDQIYATREELDKYKFLSEVLEKLLEMYLKETKS